ncbi:UPF0149 family protein [Xylophilus rhododendri]|uniref:UPF0149 family protein n=2 Tax=Xylophilus rhododendri TaxID=2697032 RepID=A0A857JBY2_9BURK|nr:UPF0149 family protein [Xylophilus rhododendri]
MPEPMTPDDFDALDDILDDLRERQPDTPSWEVCDGFLAAVVCCRRPLGLDEVLPQLFGEGAAPPAPGAALSESDSGVFSGPVQQRRFIELWQRRADEIAWALDHPVDSLEDEASYQPEVLDMVGAIASMPEEERLDIAPEDIPSIAQGWAMGFIAATQAWPEEWAPPRDKEAAAILDETLDCIDQLTEPDDGPLEIPMFAEDGPPSISHDRLDAFGEAIWAVYDLRKFWKSYGPRVVAARKSDEPGRNDPCHCGSGKKYKKCHGA